MRFETAVVPCSLYRRMIVCTVPLGWFNVFAMLLFRGSKYYRLPHLLARGIITVTSKQSPDALEGEMHTDDLVSLSIGKFAAANFHCIL